MRPDHITCVAYVLPERKTWCGVDHGEGKGRLVVCPECLAAITKALNNET